MTPVLTYTFRDMTPAKRDWLSMFFGFTDTSRLDWIDDCVCNVEIPVMMF